jgi:hypothetical protein
MSLKAWRVSSFSRTLAINIGGARIAKLSHARSSRRNIVALTLSRRETACILDALPAGA